MFTCVHRQMPSLYASSRRAPSACVRSAGECVAGHGLCLPAPCESISGYVSLCLSPCEKVRAIGEVFRKEGGGLGSGEQEEKMLGKARSWGGCLGGRVERMRQAGPDGFGMGCGVG